MPKKKQVVRLFYRPRELAAAMGCSYRTMLTMIHKDQVPAVRFPGSEQLFIPAEWVDALTANLMADYEAANANRAPEPALAASAPLGADNPS